MTDTCTSFQSKRGRSRTSASIGIVAGVSIYEMMDYLDKEKITPPQATAGDFNDALGDASTILKRSRPNKD